jgi:hypothetical protein
VHVINLGSSFLLIYSCAAIGANLMSSFFHFSVLNHAQSAESAVAQAARKPFCPVWWCFSAAAHGHTFADKCTFVFTL